MTHEQQPTVEEERQAADGFAVDDAVAGADAATAGPPGGGSVSRRLTLAVTFLTGIPLKVEGEVSPADLWRSMGWYPLVGLALGAAAWAVYAGLLALVPGLVAASVLGLSRAFGETMAVLMVVGNVARIPKSVFDPGYPLPALIANNYGEMLSIPK